MLSCFITWTTVATAFSALLTSLRYIFHACERVQGSLLCFNFRNKAYHVSFTADCKIDIFSKWILNVNSTKATFWMGNFYTSNCREVKRSIRPKNYTKMCKGLHTHINGTDISSLSSWMQKSPQTPDWIMIDRVHWPSLCTSHSNSLFDTYPLSFNWSYLLGQFISCNRGGKAS